jgi:hypothetical protein
MINGRENFFCSTTAHNSSNNNNTTTNNKNGKNLVVIPHKSWATDKNESSSFAVSGEKYEWLLIAPSCEPPAMDLFRFEHRKWEKLIITSICHYFFFAKLIKNADEEKWKRRVNERKNNGEQKE